MKKHVSIFLLFIFSFAAFVPRMDFDRLQQIPDFVAHFLEHENSENTNFIEFIYAHYGQKTQVPSDSHELPFQKHDCHIVSLTFATFLSNSVNVLPSFRNVGFQPAYTCQPTSLHIFDIWNPPRV